ncbi:hypothetical protein [Serratia sp. X10]|nr:hypothetical protein [Serratia sp. X10]
MNKTNDFAKALDLLNQMEACLHRVQELNAAIGVVDSQKKAA